VAKACHNQGATVQYLLCDGLLPECDQHWASKYNSPRPLDMCQRCRNAAETNLRSLDFPHRWLGEFIGEAKKRAAFEWAQTLSPQMFAAASFEGFPVGEWVLSSIISYFRKYPPDLADWNVANVYRGFLFSAALVCIGLSEYLDRHPVDAALLFNGRQSITRVALEIFRRREIRVLTHERAEYVPGHINIKPNAHCMNPDPFQAYWEAWSGVPLDRKALQETLRWLTQRRYGLNMAWIAFNSSAKLTPLTRSNFRSRPDRRLWVLFTSSTDEVAADPLMQGPYDSQISWVRDVISWIVSRDDIDLIVKVHPNIAGNEYIGEAASELNIYRDLKATSAPNVRIILPEESVNSYSLAEEADVGLTFGSIIGLEMAMLGKPVLLASRAVYEAGKYFIRVPSKALLESCLEQCLQSYDSRAIRREAFRLAYYYAFRFEPPFPAVKVLGLYTAEPNPSYNQRLVDPETDSLSRICNYLVNGASLFDSPSAADLSRRTKDEDTFFSHLERLPGNLRNVRYEYSLRLQSLAHAAGTGLRRLPFGIGDAVLRLGRPTWRAFLGAVEDIG